MRGACRLVAIAACVVLSVRVEAADVTWSGTTAATAWLTTTNWSTSAVPTTSDVAIFQNAGSATIAGINMGTLSGSYGLQAIVVDSTRTRALTIGNSSATSGTLTLLGGTVSGTANVILRNASGSLLTVQDNDSGTGKTMRVALGNATDNVILLDGTGGMTISSMIVGTNRNLTITGTGAGVGTNVLTLSAANTYSGTTTIGRGAVLASNNSALGTSTLVVASGAQLRLANGVTINRPATIAGTGFSNTSGAIFANDTGGATATYSGNITLSADGTRIGAQGQSGGGTLIVSGTIDSGANPYGLVIRNAGGDLGFVQVSAANTYLGSTWIAIGTLRLAGGDNRLPATTNLRLGYTASGTWNAVLELNGRNQEVAGLSLDAATTVAGSNNIISNTSATLSTFTVNADATASTYNGILTGNLKLVKAGTNSLTFTGTGANYGTGSSYTGGVDINAGTIVAASANVLGTGPLAINSGTLDMRSSVTTGLLTGSSGATITGGTTGNLTLTLNSASSGTYAGSILNGSATNLGLAKQGVGTLTLTGSSTFNNGVNLTGGVLAFASIADSGSASAIGASGVLRMNGGIFNYVGTGHSSNRLFTFGVGSGTSNQTLTFRANGSGALNLTNTGSTPWGAGGTRTMALGGTSTSLNTYAPLVADNTFNSITYAAAITKNDAGTWLLTGSNSFTGGTTINAGTLIVGNTTALGATSGTLTANGGTLDLNGRSITVGLLTGASGATITSNTTGSVTLTASSASSGTFGGVISSGAGTVGLTKGGAGTLTLTGANTYTGATQVNAGVLAIGAADALSNSTTVTVGGGALDLGGFADTVASVTITSGSIIGSGGTLTASTYGLGGGTVAGNLGAGTLTVTANSALNGTADATVVNLNSGTLTLGSAGRLTSAAVAVSGSSGAAIALGGNEAFGSLAGAANVALGSGTLSVGGAGTSTSYSGVISGLGGLTKTGAGTLTLGGANSYTGPTQVNAGVLALGAADALSNSTAVTVGGGALDLAGFSETVASVAITSGSIIGTGGTLTASTYDLGGGTVAVSLGAGTLTVTANSALNGTAAASAVNLNSGTLTLGSGGRFTSSTVAVGGSSGGAIVLGGNEAFGSLAGAANVALGSSTLSVGGVGTSTSYSGVISGSGDFVKTGAGTLSLTNIQTFTGTTTIGQGVLALNSGASIASSSFVKVAGGAVLDASGVGGLVVAPTQTLGGSGTVAGGFTIANGATLSPGNSPGTLSASGVTTWGGAGNYNWQIYTAAGGVGTGTGWDFVDSTGSLVIAATGGSPFSINMWSLSGVGPDVNGTVSDFDPSYDYNFLIAEFDGGITGFDPTKFSLNTGATNGTGGFQNTFDGQFSVARGDTVSGGNSNQIYIVYAAVPEPGTLALAGIGLVAVGWAAGRRRGRRHVAA